MGDPGHWHYDPLEKARIFELGKQDGLSHLGGDKPIYMGHLGGEYSAGFKEGATESFMASVKRQAEIDAASRNARKNILSRPLPNHLRRFFEDL